MYLRNTDNISFTKMYLKGDKYIIMKYEHTSIYIKQNVQNDF